MRIAACFAIIVCFSDALCGTVKKIAKNNSEENSKVDSDSFENHISRMQIDKKKYKIPEIVLGNSKAKYNLVIYSSFSCDHCRKFHITELHKFIKKYVDTGKVKLIFRYFIDDIASFEASVFIVHLSADDDKIAFRLMETVFEQQDNWRKAKNQPLFLRQLLAKTMQKICPKSLSYYLQQMELCLDVRTDLGKSVGGRVILGQKEADKMGVMSTPCLIFNGIFDKYNCLTNASCRSNPNKNEPLRIKAGYCHQGVLNCDTMWQFCSQNFDKIS